MKIISLFLPMILYFFHGMIFFPLTYEIYHTVYLENLLCREKEKTSSKNGM